MKMWSFYRGRRNPLIGSAKIISSSLQQSFSRLHLSAGKNTTCSRFSVFSTITVASKSKPRLGFYQQRFDLGRRFYHHSSEDPNRRPYYKQWKKLLTFSAVIYGYHLVSKGNNIVPYTNRTRILLFPIKMFNTIFETPMKSSDLVTKTDPQSVRVKWILKDITDALYKDLKKNGVKVKHLDGLKWEIFVTPTAPDALAASLPGGKILISSKLLRDFTTDAEVATVIGHEVAHIVAGHHAERFITLPLVALILLLPLLIFTYLVPIPCVADKIRDLPYRSMRRQELEADYIGMILIALAGYDPQVAPSVYVKLDKLYGGSDLSPTHPSGEKRALMLFLVMEDARAKYMEVEASK